MRRLLVALLLVGLLIPSGTEARRARKGGGSAAVVQSGGSPPTYYEITTVQTLATNGYPTFAMAGQGSGPAFSSDAAYLVYMDNSGGTAGAHNIYVKKYSYLTGAWTTSASLGTVNPLCCDGHEAPQVYRDASGYLWVFAGGITAGETGNGPFYWRSTSPDDISAWQTVARVPDSGGFSEQVGGFDSSGVLHILGQQQNNGTIASYEMTYAQKSAADVWSVMQLVWDGSRTSQSGKANGLQGDPGCIPSLFVTGTTLHLVWGRMTDGCTSFNRDLYYAQSTNGGTTFLSIDGSASFTSASGLQATWNAGEALYTYPTAYRVHTGSVNFTQKVAALSTGRPIIVAPTAGGLVVYRWTGSAWASTTIVEAVPYGVALAITAADKIYIHSTPAGENVVQHTSTDGGVSFVTTTLHTKGAETCNRHPLSRRVASLGGKERILLQWVQCTSTGTATNIVFKDIPQ